MVNPEGNFPPFILQRLFDEGTENPFFARLFSGILELRDYALSFLGGDINDNRSKFDSLYKPVWESLLTARNAAIQIDEILVEHLQKISARNVLQVQPNAVVISENISKNLRDLLNSFLINGVIAATSVQKVTKLFGLDIHCLYGKPTNFKRGIKKLIDDGYDSFARFLCDVREWYEPFKKQQNLLEHEGWVLEDVRYDIQNGWVYIPTVQGLPINDYAKNQFNRLASFIENIVVYSFSLNLNRLIVIDEIPYTEREPSNPQRFRYNLRQHEGHHWDIYYSEDKFLL